MDKQSKGLVHPTPSNMMQEAINIQDTRIDAKTMVATVIKEAREDAVDENQWKIEMNNSTEWNLNLADKDEEYVK